MSASSVLLRDSPVEGTGVFAARAFEAGETIRRITVVREVTAEDPIREGERVEHCCYPDGRVLLLGAPDRHLNHSCDPNAFKRFLGPDAMEVVARRAIPQGQEITLDYLINTSGGGRWSCACGAARCRGVLFGGFFDLPRSFQREYLPLLAPWFVARHADEVAELQRQATGSLG